MFLNLCRDPRLRAVVCVLDGLDECDEDTRIWLAAKLIDFTSSDNKISNAFKVLIISRDMPSLRRSPQVKLDPDNDEPTGLDIQRFVSMRVQELSGLIGFDHNFGQTLTDALIERAEGTFLWVGFAVVELLRKRTCSEIEEAVHSLPKGLRAIYALMLRRIPQKHRKVCSLMLRWVTMAVRPLSLQELARAVDIKSTALRTVDEAIWDQVKICSPFLVVQEQSVCLVHQSARDYLLHGERDDDVEVE